MVNFESLVVCEATSNSVKILVVDFFTSCFFDILMHQINMRKGQRFRSCVSMCVMCCNKIQKAIVLILFNPSNSQCV